MVQADIYFREDTIAALSTPPGSGAIAVIRISGPQALAVGKTIFRSPKHHESVTPRMLQHGKIVDSATAEVIDEVLYVEFPAPHSYTGEDMVEIHGHGSPAVVKRMLSLLLQMGIRPAEPGEFTFRAVRHGKMDLAQAEAVHALIQSRSQLARALSLRMLEGEFSRSLTQIKNDIIHLLIDLETQIEFPEDAPEAAVGTAIQESLAALVRQIESLQQRAMREQRFEQGILVVLAGRPNVGKSSLFNRLLGRERAIVTPHPGTTRDSLEGTIELQGKPVTLIDTAGLRETQEEIEAIGVQRSRELLTTSHIVLFIVEAGKPLSAKDEKILQELHNLSSPTRIILVANKRDLATGNPESETSDFSRWNGMWVTASAMESNGVDELITRLEQEVTQLFAATPESAFLITAHQEQCLNRIAENGMLAEQWWKENPPLELIAELLRKALAAVAELDGSGVTPDIMHEIFSRFCIGK